MFARSECEPRRRRRGLASRSRWQRLKIAGACCVAPVTAGSLDCSASSYGQPVESPPIHQHVAAVLRFLEMRHAGEARPLQRVAERLEVASHELLDLGDGRVRVASGVVAHLDRRSTRRVPHLHEEQVALGHGVFVAPGLVEALEVSDGLVEARFERHAHE